MRTCRAVEVIDSPFSTHQMSPRFLSIAATAIILGTSCTGSKPLAKKAAKLDGSGMYAEAADLYLQSAMRNPRNVDAKIGLRRTGQMLLNDKLSSFFKAFSMGEDKEAAVNAFLTAKDYQDLVQRAGVSLEVPENYSNDFKQVKGEYLVQLYTRGQELLDRKEYNAAEATFAKIGKLEPGYKDATSLQDVAFLEPLYLAGKAALEAGQYRKAYADLARVTERNGQYKDATSLKQRCVEKGRYPIAVMPFSSTGGASKAQALTMQAYVTAALTELNDPFISVVDRDNIQKILDEQKLGMSGVVDEASAVSAGKLMGAQAVLMGTVIAFQEIPGLTQRSSKEGYEAYQVKELNAETNQYVYVTRYRPTHYTELALMNRAQLSISYKLVSLETGQVLLSKVLEREASDQARYASYEGNAQALYPKLNGNVDTRSSARRELAALLGATHEVKPTAVLANELVRSSSALLASGISKELMERLP